MRGCNSLPCQWVHHSLTQKLDATMKSAFSKGCNVMRWVEDKKDTRSKEMAWLNANMHVNKMDLQKNMVPLMIIFLPNVLDDKDGWKW